METFLTIVYVLVCLFLILVVLLQSGKGGGLGTAIGGGGGGGGAQQVFGGAGASNIPVCVTSFVSVFTPQRRAIFQQGCRGWLICTTLLPARNRSPMQTSASVAPSSVKFSANAPGPMFSSGCSTAHAW